MRVQSDTIATRFFGQLLGFEGTFDQFPLVDLRAIVVGHAETGGHNDGGFLGLGLDANEKVWIIVGGLVVIALVLLVLTVIYWRHTRPGRRSEDDPSDPVDDRSSGREKKRRRRAEAKDPSGDAGEEDGPRDPSSGPLDLDGLLGAPDPGRLVFGSPDEPEDSSR